LKSKRDNIAGVDGSLKFSNLETDLQANDTALPPTHKFHYLGGKAVLAPSNNPSVYVIKIVLTVGSADVIVTMNTTSTTETTSTTDSTSKTTTTTKGGGKVYDIGLDVEVKVEWADPVTTRGSATTRSSGTTKTIGELSKTATWQLSLKLPEPKLPAPPFEPEQPFTFYFATGSSDVEGYASPLSNPPKQDQIKLLQVYMEQFSFRWGIENIASVDVVGYASELGKTTDNIKLSRARADYVKDLLSMLNIYKVPPDKITPKGSPISAPRKDDNPKDRKAELHIKVKGGVKPILEHVSAGHQN
jgi:outer membrane protein OmpA-like peptidoglycan-associated protein